MKERTSRQAEAVLSVLSARPCHLSAEEIHELLPDIGTATIYRALDHLTENGQLRRLNCSPKRAVYEYARKEHMHLICRRCNTVFDVPVDLSGMVKQAALCSGHLAEQTEITAYGICTHCQEAEATSIQQ